MRRFKVSADHGNRIFGVVAAHNDQDARDLAAIKAGYPSERAMEQHLGRPSKIELQEIDESEGTIRIYPTESCPLVDGDRIRREPTRKEVLAYFSHPPQDLIEFYYWSVSCAHQRRQGQWKFTTAEVAGVNPMHQSIFVSCVA